VDQPIFTPPIKKEMMPDSYALSLRGTGITEEKYIFLKARRQSFGAKVGRYRREKELELSLPRFHSTAILISLPQPALFPSLIPHGHTTAQQTSASLHGDRSPIGKQKKTYLKLRLRSAALVPAVEHLLVPAEAGLQLTNKKYQHGPGSLHIIRKRRHTSGYLYRS
jgi:hypothetical protein